MARYDAITQAAINYLASREVQMRQALADLVEAKHPGAIERARQRNRAQSFERKFVGPVPTWAKRYVSKYGEGNVASLTIRQSRTKAHTSGHCWYGEGRLVVTFGIPDSSYGEVERKATVLHEIAHSLARWNQHGDQFYDEWYRMLREENLYRQTLDCGRFVGTSSLRAAARRARGAKAA